MWFDIIDFAIARAFKANLVDLASSHISQRLIHAMSQYTNTSVAKVRMVH